MDLGLFQSFLLGRIQNGLFHFLGNQSHSGIARLGIDGRNSGLVKSNGHIRQLDLHSGLVAGQLIHGLCLDFHGICLLGGSSHIDDCVLAGLHLHGAIRNGSNTTGDGDVLSRSKGNGDLGKLCLQRLDPVFIEAFVIMIIAENFLNAGGVHPGDGIPLGFCTGEGDFLQLNGSSAAIHTGEHNAQLVHLL